MCVDRVFITVSYPVTYINLLHGFNHRPVSIREELAIKVLRAEVLSA